MAHHPNCLLAMVVGENTNMTPMQWLFQLRRGLRVEVCLVGEQEDFCLRMQEEITKGIETMMMRVDAVVEEREKEDGKKILAQCFAS